MTNDLKSRLSELEKTLTAIAGQRFYLTTADELGLTISHNCGGFACGGLSRLVEAKLPGRFTGDRATVVLNETQFSDRFDDDDLRYLNAIVAHELAHCCDMWPGALPVYPASAEAIALEVQSQVKLPPRDWHRGPNKLPTWHGHQDRFLRALAHVQFRLNQIGLNVDSFLAFPDQYYELEPLPCYVADLESELEARQREPIGQILASEPPRLFSELWRIDSEHGRAMQLAAFQSID